ncbi:MAG: glycerol-3-phosphate 1-O-acyltransferase PlsY [Eubacteriales bacterium]|nr:glycerol-3-phosphate 1-O-acyltransferase PlsY [Eubacteriales bacterium]
MRPVDILILLAFTAGGYFLGGVSPSVAISRRIGGFDVREVGSGNAGSTNILRSMGWGFGLLNLFLDALKGAIPVLIARLVLPEGLCRELAMALAGLAVIVGHNFSPYMKFKGGKGVATSLGVITAIVPWLGAAGLGVAVLCVLLTGYVSVGSLVGTLAVTVACWAMPSIPLSTDVMCLCALALMAWMHRDNIKRLCKGEERKLSAGRRRKKGETAQPPADSSEK